MKTEEKSLFIDSKLKKTEAFINEVTNLLQFRYLETAVNRCYYCCFYCAQALLAEIDVYPKSHRGVITLFNLHYAKPEIFPPSLADFLQEIFTQRQMVDYGDVHDVSQEMADAFLKNTQLFFEKTKAVLQNRT